MNTITKSQLRQMIKEVLLKEQSDEDQTSLGDFEPPATDPQRVARAVTFAASAPLKDWGVSDNKRMKILMKIRKLVIEELGQD